MTLLYLTLAWTAGILLGHLLWSGDVIGCATPGWPFAAAAGVTALTLVARRRDARTRLPLALLLFIVLGGWRYHSHPVVWCSTPADVAQYNSAAQDGTRSVVEGVVVGYPDVRDTYTGYRLRAETLTIDGQARSVHGDILVRAARFPTYSYGDRLRVTGYLQEPPVFDDFDYRAYLSRQGIHSLMRRARVELVERGQGAPFWSVLYGVRARGAALLERALPEPEAALAKGMLLGIEGGIPSEVYDAYRATGTAHVIVISGSNIALMAGVLVFLAGGPLGRRRAAWAALAGVALYVLLTGAQPPALRAGLMAGLMLIAVIIGRQSTAWVSLVAAALFMTLLDPLTLWDIGFQLSFMATLGLILFTPPMTAAWGSWLERRPMPAPARRVLRAPGQMLIVTLAAQITVAPLLAHYFGQLSLISLPANLLILPAQPPIMGGGMATLLAGLVWEPLGRIAAVIPWLFLRYTNAVVRLAADVPHAAIDIGAMTGIWVLSYYGILFGVLAARRVGPGLARLGRGLLPAGRTPLPIGRAAARAALAAVPLWLGLSLVSGLPDGRLHLVFLPGREPETTLVITPRGQRLWVEGLADSGGGSETSAQRWPGWRPRDPDLILSPRAGGQAASAARVIGPDDLAPGGAVTTADGVTLTRVAADDSWAIALRYGRFGALLATRLSQDDQMALSRAADSLPPVTVVMVPASAVPHLDPAFLDRMAPQVVLRRTDESDPVSSGVGWAVQGIADVPPGAAVEVVTDGEAMWLRQWSPSGRR